MGKGSKYDDNAEDARGVALYGFLEGTTNIVPILVDADGNIQTTPISPSAVTSGRKAVTTAGTAEKLVAAPTPCKKVQVSVDLGSTNPMVIGGSTVVATSDSQAGIVLIPGNAPVDIEIDDVSKLYIDAQTNGDAVCFTYYV